MRRGTRRVVVSATVLAALTIGSLVTPAGAVGSDRRLPPSDRDALARIFDPMLEELGLRTTRARLQNLDSYEEDPRGRHLAVYVEPIDNTYTDAEYIENFVPVAQVFLPKVFNRWKGLRSFDVCQEPRPDGSTQRAPPPLTQIQVTRRGASTVRWKDATLDDVLAAALEREREGREPEFFTVYFDRALELQAALVEARERVGVTEPAS